MQKKAILIIMDGWGLGNHSRADVISNADIHFYKSLIENPKVLKSKLMACGEDVGLPEGQMGNSEVGHLNIGAGRIVYQDLVRINKAIERGSFQEKECLKDAFNYAKENKKKVHFLGLVSDGWVHANTAHLVALSKMATTFGIEDVFIHVLTDGRDTDPKSGKGYVKELMDNIQDTNARIASVCGRYYTMDRDNRWERVKEGYDLLVSGKGKEFTDPIQAIQSSYDENVTDEFIKPSVIIDENGKPLTTVEERDVFICFNFRTDRLREITTVLTQQDMPELSMKTMPLHYLTMAKYDDSFKKVTVIYEKEDVQETLGEIISRNNKTQLRIAETEKYPHVTFFFSGGREDVFPGEDRILIPSPKVATYDLKPSMSAYEVKDAVIKSIREKAQDFICLNFANPDMVGHTGIYEAIKEAVETVDQCVKEVSDVALENGYSVLITADHGNADSAVNQDGSPNTAHSLNPVPFIVLDKDSTNLKDGRLSDIAPTILNILGIDIPEAMIGENLIS